jgi:hypothetical protein
MAANVVLSFNQITFRTGLLLSLSGTRIHYRTHCSGKVTAVSTPVHNQHSRWTRIEKLYHVNDHKSANRVYCGFFPRVSQLSLKRRQQRLRREHVRSSGIAGSGKFRLHQLHLANGQARP